MVDITQVSLRAARDGSKRVIYFGARQSPLCLHKQGELWVLRYKENGVTVKGVPAAFKNLTVARDLITIHLKNWLNTRG